MRSQTTKRQLKNKHAHVSNCARTSTSLCLHKSGSTGLFHTSSCRKRFDFLKVNVQVIVALDQGISRLCDLCHHNLWNRKINIRRMTTSRFIRRIPASRFIRRIPASRFIRQLTHWLCMFRLRIAPSLLDSVSSESQPYYRTTSLVCFGCVTFCHQICFVLKYARCVNFFSTTSCTYMYFSITCFILPSPLLDAHAFAD